MTDIIQDIEEGVQDVETDGKEALAWFEGTKLGAAVIADAKEAESVLETLGAQQAEQAGLTIATAALTGLATGGAAGAFAAGVAAAPAALKQAETNISTGAINAVVSNVVSQIQAQQATVAAPTA